MATTLRCYYCCSYRAGNTPNDTHDELVRYSRFVLSVHLSLHLHDLSRRMAEVKARGYLQDASCLGQSTRTLTPGMHLLGHLCPGLFPSEPLNELFPQEWTETKTVVG